MKEKTLGEVYLVTCLVTGKQYVGITARGYLNRWKKHVATSKTKATGLHEDIAKFGEDNFKIEVIESKLYANRDRMARWLFNRERYWIAYYGTFGNGYNLTAGGDGVTGARKSKVIRELMREMMKDLYENHPEEKAKRLEKAHAKLRDPEYRKVNSERQKARFANPAERQKTSRLTKEAMQKLPPKVKEKIRNAQFKKGHETWNKGLETPDEVKKKISESEKGRIAWNKGVSMPEEQKRKVSESKKGTPAWNKGLTVTRKEACPVCGKLICWNMLNKHIRARHTK